jgi:hypothetical protein
VYQRNIYLDLRKKKNAKDEQDLLRELVHSIKVVEEYLQVCLDQGLEHNGK